MNRTSQGRKRIAMALMTACVFVVGCGGSERPNPAAPSSAAAPVVSSSVATAVTTASSPAAVGAAADADALSPGMSSINFPPRNEPFAFRQSLEVKYRDGLRRSPQSSFVDIEGTIVWTQEYLRYRVNGCPHFDAIQRVFRQIDGFGVQPVCSFFESPFPPRQEPFDFMLQLEIKYRDQLRRSPVQTFVDIEGNIVWTQEYLRYRTSGCNHFESEQKVFRQIDGFGVQPDCAPVAVLRITGTVRSFGFNDHPIFIGNVAPTTMDVLLTWPDSSVDLDLYLTGPNCVGYPPDNCTILAASVSSFGNSERLSWFVRPGERYTLHVDNFAFVSQAYELLATLRASGLTDSGSQTTVQFGEMTAHTKPAGTKKSD